MDVFARENLKPNFLFETNCYGASFFIHTYLKLFFALCFWFLTKLTMFFLNHQLDSLYFSKSCFYRLSMRFVRSNLGDVVMHNLVIWLMRNKA